MAAQAHERPESINLASKPKQMYIPVVPVYRYLPRQDTPDRSADDVSPKDTLHSNDDRYKRVTPDDFVVL